MIVQNNMPLVIFEDGRRLVIGLYAVKVSKPSNMIVAVSFIIHPMHQKLFNQRKVTGFSIHDTEAVAIRGEPDVEPQESKRKTSR